MAEERAHWSTGWYCQNQGRLMVSCWVVFELVSKWCWLYSASHWHLWLLLWLMYELLVVCSISVMSMRGLSTSLVWWCTGVCITGRLGTSLITSSQPLMLLLDVFIYYPLTWIVSLFLAADLTVGLFITLARQSGTRCQMNLEILTVLMALSDSWKQFFSAITSMTSALEVY